MYQMGRRPAFDLVTNEQQFKEGREAHTVFYDERLIHNRHIEDRICMSEKHRLGCNGMSRIMGI
jgi:hypothetical protein